MAAMSVGLETPPEQFGLAVLADNVVYVVWLPLLLASKAFAEKFNRWARVPEDRLAQMEAAAELEAKEEKVVSMTDYINLAFLAVTVTAVSAAVSKVLPVIKVTSPLRTPRSSGRASGRSS